MIFLEVKRLDSRAAIRQYEYVRQRFSYSHKYHQRWRHLQMRKTILELLLDRQLFKENLEYNQTCIRSQSLIFELDFRNLVLSAHYFDFARHHLGWPPALGIMVLGELHFAQSEGHFSII
jgi:hypothetical protein